MSFQLQKQVPPFSRILNIAWKRYVLHFDIILPTVLLVAIPGYLLVDFLAPRELLNQEISTVQQLWELVQKTDYLVYFIMQLLTSAALVFTTIVVILKMKSVYVRKEVSLIELWKSATKLYPKVLLAFIVVAATTAGGYLLLVIPGVFISVMFSFALPAMIWHNVSVMEALKISWQLVKRAWWLVFSYLVLAELLVGLVAAFVAIVMPVDFGWRTLVFVITAVFNVYLTVFNVILFTIISPVQALGGHSNTNAPQRAPEKVEGKDSPEKK